MVTADGLAKEQARLRQALSQAQAASSRSLRIPPTWSFGGQRNKATTGNQACQP